MLMHPWFEHRVDVAPNGCWLWRASVNSWGYGRTRTTLTTERSSHRISWTLHCGQIPAGANVLHKCDTPRCVNPGHLFLGTHAANVQDCLAKGRHFAPRGERHGLAKLTYEAADKIRESAKKRSVLAQEFGVSRRAIQFVQEGKTWSR